MDRGDTKQTTKGETMRIRYTFKEDCPIAELRGKEVRGGVFCAASGSFSDPIDAVRFTTRIAGKTIMARIAGKPELEEELGKYNAAKKEEERILDGLGWPEYQKAQLKVMEARIEYDLASESGYPVEEAEDLRIAELALKDARAKFPEAARYAMAENYSLASHFEKSAAGSSAMRKIESGGDPKEAVETMQAEWSEAASRCVNNS